MTLSPTFTTDVLVIGAGPTGLVAAAELAATGVRVMLIDKYAAPSTRSRALVVQARTLEIFQKMGLADEFLAAGRPATSLELFVEGRRKATFEFHDIGVDDTPYPFILIISQAETETILRRYLARLGVEVMSERELVGLTQDAEGVEATVDAREGRTTIRCRYAIGCDGAHSKVRHALGLTFNGAPYDQEFLLADVRVANWPQPINGLQIFLSLQGILLMFPMAGKANARLVMSRVKRQATTSSKGGEPQDAKDLDIGEARLAARALTAAPIILEDPQWLATFKLHHRGVDRYRVGRVFVAGDAAHIHSPAGGQGMNTGIQDAFNLAWKVNLVATGLAPEDLLDSYHAERHPVGQFLLKRTDRFFQLMTVRNPLLLRLRNWSAAAAVRVVFRGPKALRRKAFRFVSELGIRYLPNGWVAPGAGQRAPDAKACGSTIFELTKTRKFHLLCFDAEAPSGLDPRVVSTHSMTRQNAPEAFGRYGFQGADKGFCLVRPDGYVAFSSHTGDTTGVAKVLERFMNHAPRRR